MIMRRHPHTADWGVWSVDCLPDTLVASIRSNVSYSGKKYFIIINTGSGLTVDSANATYSVAEASYLTLSNDSDNDSYLGGSGRALELAHNPTTHKIQNGISVAR